MVNENLQLRVKVDQFGQEKADWIHDFDKTYPNVQLQIESLTQEVERRTDDLMEAHNQLRDLKKRLRDMQKERNMAKVEYEAGEHWWDEERSLLREKLLQALSDCEKLRDELIAEKRRAERIEQDCSYYRSQYLELQERFKRLTLEYIREKSEKELYANLCLELREKAIALEEMIFRKWRRDVRLTIGARWSLMLLGKEYGWWLEAQLG